MIALLLATRNAHKVKEIRAILRAEATCLSLEDFPGAPDVVEDRDSFAENAAKKASKLAHWLAATIGSGALPDYVLADDSGLEVDALNGAPGVHSARFTAANPAGGNSPDKDNLNKLLRLLQDVPPEKRGARFRCVIALATIGPSASIDNVAFFTGTCEGAIALTARGERGFGYDPAFIPAGYNQSFGELGEDVKNTLSHRARALNELKEWLARRPKAAQ